MHPTPSVTVVVPCFNEEEKLPHLLARLRAMRTGRASDWEFLFIDDGSTDDTFARLLCAARDQPWVSVLRHPDNHGLGAALRTAFAHVSSPIVCTVDSECTYPPERLPELTALIERGADIATATPWPLAEAGAAGEGGRLRLLFSRPVSGIYKQLVGKDVDTLTCPFRAYRREVLQRITFRGDGFSAVGELFLKALRAGYVVREVPMRLEQRSGESKRTVRGAVLAHAHLITLATLAVGSRQAREALRR